MAGNSRPSQESHHTRLKAVQWISVNRHVVKFTTLSKRATDRIMNPMQSGSRPMDAG